MSLNPPELWQFAQLEDLLTHTLGGDWGKDPDHEDTEYEYAYCIRASEIPLWVFNKGSTAALRKIKKASIEKRALVVGDILVEISGGGPTQPVGRTILIDEAVLSINPQAQKICTNFFRQIRPSCFISAKYLELFLKSIYSSPQINELQSGSNNLRNLKFNDYLKLPVPVPPLSQQKKIVQKIEELFSEIDGAIQSLETAKKQLVIYRQSLFKNAFTGNFTIDWRNENMNQPDSLVLLNHYQKIRESNYLAQLKTWKELSKEWEKDKSRVKPSKPSKLKKIVENSKHGITNFPEIPESWNYIRLGYLTEDPVYGTSKKCAYEISDGIGVLRIPNISAGFIDSTDLKFAYFSDEEIASYKLEEDDILTIRSNGSVSLVGKTALVRSADSDKLFAGYLIRLRPFKQHVNSKYLYYAFESQFVRNQIEFLAKSTSGVNNINSSELQSLIIPIPSLEEQNEIVNQLENLFDAYRMLSEQLEVEIKKAIYLKRSILTKAFSGQLVPQDPNDEPASVLLERIKAEKAEELAKAKANKAPKKSGTRKTKATTKENDQA